jgi:hypothetical protein
VVVCTLFYPVRCCSEWKKTFQRDGTVQLFGTKGQKFLHCPGTKGQRDKLKILPRDGTAKIWDGTGRDSQNLGQDAGQNGAFVPALVPGQRDTGTRIFFCPETKGQRDVPSRFVPGHPVPWKPYYLHVMCI